MTSSTGRPVLVFIGPSASGKSSVVRELHDAGVITVHPTWTTRPRRLDETEGSPEHRFVTPAEFDELCAQHFFVDTVAMFGLPHRYGLPPVHVTECGPIDAVMLRAPLVARFAQVVPQHLVYQIEDNADRTRARLIARGCPSAELAARIDDNYDEIIAGRRLADRVFVNDGSIAELVDKITSALRADVLQERGAA
ncbi:MAG: guanylate kinase [Acidimicrobiaceae bacterium]|jgi:guanylate kinase